MPRQFRTITYGSGYCYRSASPGIPSTWNCTTPCSAWPNWREDPETVALLALFRLMTPEGLR